MKSIADIDREGAASSDADSCPGSNGAEPRLWDANDVARYIGASRSWVYHQAEAGRLPCIRILGFLRFDPQAVRAFVTESASANYRSGLG
jgi:predicted DNA-binding transcriptional regulator AlpA